MAWQRQIKGFIKPDEQREIEIHVPQFLLLLFGVSCRVVPCRLTFFSVCVTNVICDLPSRNTVTECQIFNRVCWTEGGERYEGEDAGTPTNE